MRRRGRRSNGVPVLEARLSESEEPSPRRRISEQHQDVFDDGVAITIVEPDRDTRQVR